MEKKKNSTLHYDETLKYGRKTGPIEVTAGGISFPLGFFDKD